MKKSGGSRANRRGKEFEKSIEGVLEDIGYQFVNSDRFSIMQDKEPIYTRQYKIGKDIYGTDRKVDIILYHPQLWINWLVIECKWQTSEGSVDKKYPFEVFSIEYNKYDTIMILDGGGYSEKAKKWLYDQAGIKKRLKYVFNKIEFSRFVSKGKLG